MSHHSSHDSQEGSAPVKRGPGILLLCGVFVLLLAAVIAGLRLVGGPGATEAEDAERSAVRLKNLAELRAADTNELTTYGWADRAKGVVRIPVSKAMELVLPELNARGAGTASPQTQP